MSDADFRSERTPPPSLFTATQHAILGTADSLALEPLKWTASQLNGAHQIRQRTLFFDGSAQSVRNYGFAGGRRTSDGVWAFSFDELGRLSTATNSAAGRRIEFQWDPNDRIAGRTAYQSNGAGGWTIETRSTVLGADALPAETTFVWDPIVDRLVAVYEKGASSVSGAAATAGLIRQYLHGDQGYDDPIEVRAAETPGGVPQRYLPVIDHAGTGSLMATLADNGDVIERVIYADSYGDAPRYLQGPIVDKVTFLATKDASGNVQAVAVRVHLDERIVASSVAGSMSLAAVTSNQPPVTVYTISADPIVENSHTLLWSLTSSDWTALTTASGAQSLEIGVKDRLRCEGWGSAAVQPVPSWALRLYGGTATTPQMPVMVRESFSSLTAFINGLPSGPTDPRTLYEIPNLYLAAEEKSKAKLLTGFQALPFFDAATGLLFARSRWYDASTGTFLSPDRLGYHDSSNQYAFAGGDPVNGRDPTGLCMGIGGISCADAWRLGVKQLMDEWSALVPSTASKTLDKKMRQVREAPVRVMLKPAELIATTGESTGGYLDRMHEATFQGGAPFGAKEDDMSLATGAAGDVMMLLAPLEMLEGEAPVLRKQGTARVGFPRRVGAAKAAPAAAAADTAVTRAHPLQGWTRQQVIAQAESLGLATPPSAFLPWSGLGPGDTGIIRSQAYAREFGGMTLEMTPGGRWLHGMDIYGTGSPFTQVEADLIWGSVARSASNQASGQIRVLLGQVRPTSFYQTIELPTLLDNPRVLGIERIYLKPRYKFGGGR